MQITARKLIAYPVAIFTILLGLAYLPESVIGGFLLVLAGVMALPVFRIKLKESRDIEITGWATVILFVAIFAVGLSLTQMEPSSTGFEGDTVTKDPVDIVPSIDDFSETGWSGSSKEIPLSQIHLTDEADSAAKGTYSKGVPNLKITVLIYSSDEKAKADYKQITEKEMGSQSTTEPNIGDESKLTTKSIVGIETSNLIFREENMVCKVYYEGTASNPESVVKKYGRKVIENLG